MSVSNGSFYDARVVNLDTYFELTHGLRVLAVPLTTLLWLFADCIE